MVCIRRHFICVVSSAALSLRLDHSGLAPTLILPTVVGAVFVDRGYRQARAFVLRWLGDLVDEAISGETRKDPKSLLQEFLQAKGSKPPRYELVSESGPPSDLVFTIEVVIGSESVASGSGSRKIDAEREAASRAIQILKSEDH